MKKMLIDAGEQFNLILNKETQLALSSHSFTFLIISSDKLQCRYYNLNALLKNCVNIITNIIISFL
jgi:hypothetical protein